MNRPIIMRIFWSVLSGTGFDSVHIQEQPHDGSTDGQKTISSNQNGYYDGMYNTRSSQ